MEVIAGLFRTCMKLLGPAAQSFMDRAARDGNNVRVSAITLAQ